MLTLLIDYDSGNLHSAQKAFERMAADHADETFIVTSDADMVAKADRIVLPGDGAFPACKKALTDRHGLFQALTEAVEVKGRPFMGICIGMQMMASRGHEHGETAGLDWISGDVRAVTPTPDTLKVPHMGWNDLVVTGSHPVMDGIKTGDHCYFVHSYQFEVESAKDRLAHCEYGGDITAIVGRDTFIGTQFHPEKSQSTGLRLISNFLSWRP